MTNDPIKKSELTERGHSELLAIYNASVSAIAFVKSQQWKATNYAILLYVAVIGTAKIVKDAGDFSTVSFRILFLLVLLIFLYGLHILEKLEKSLIEERIHSDKIVTLFDKNIREELFKDIMPASEKTTLIILFRLILIIGFLIDVWILILWI